MAKQPKPAPQFQRGDEVKLRATITRIMDDDRGFTMLTLRIEGYDYPVTINANWVETKEGGR
jgi:hypothetical protein